MQRAILKWMLEQLHQHSVSALNCLSFESSSLYSLIPILAVPKRIDKFQSVTAKHSCQEDPSFLRWMSHWANNKLSGGNLLVNTCNYLRRHSIATFLNFYRLKVCGSQIPEFPTRMGSCHWGPYIYKLVRLRNSALWYYTDKHIYLPALTRLIRNWWHHLEAGNTF